MDGKENSGSVFISSLSIHFSALLKLMQKPLSSLYPPSKTSVRIGYQKPEEIGCFSYDENRKISFDASSLKIFKSPCKFPLDLNDGYPAGYKSKAEYAKSNPEHLDPICAVLQETYQQQKDGSMVWPGADAKPPSLITWRGILTRIVTLPFLKRESLKLNVIKRNQTLCMEEVMDDEYWSRHEGKSSSMDRQKRMMYWGYRFEAFCCFDMAQHEKEGVSGLISEDHEEPSYTVNTMQEFGIVSKGKLGNHRLFIGAEVDAIDESSSSYIELKTNRQGSRMPFPKCLKMWTQSFLIGIEDLAIGLRDDDGMLNKIERVKVSDLLRRNGIENCDRNFLLGFASNFLDWLLETCDTDQKYRLIYDPESQSLSLTPDNNISDFIPDSFNKDEKA